MKVQLFSSIALAGLMTLSPAFGKSIISLHQQNPADAQITNAELALSDVTAQADELLSLSKLQDLSFETNAGHLTYIKDDVNRLGTTLKKLENSGKLNQWQSTAVKRMEASGPALAAETTDALTQLNEQHNPVFAPKYHQDLERIYSNAKSLDASLHRLEQLEKVQGKVHQLNKEEHQLNQQLGS